MSSPSVILADTPLEDAAAAVDILLPHNWVDLVRFATASERSSLTAMRLPTPACTVRDCSVAELSVLTLTLSPELSHVEERTRPGENVPSYLARKQAKMIEVLQICRGAASNIVSSRVRGELLCCTELNRYYESDRNSVPCYASEYTHHHLPSLPAPILVTVTLHGFAGI